MRSASPGQLSEPLFSPAEAERERREAMHAARKRPIRYGNRPGTNRKAAPERNYREALEASREATGQLAAA